ncbi:MAG: ABC transporter permease [Firmicutes bacterium]|nr:ABC transporter permease [Bacillota bacterium]
MSRLKQILSYPQQTIEDYTRRRQLREEQKAERFHYASQRQLIWWRFKKHKLAMLGMIVLFVMYFVSIFAEFFSPYPVENRIKNFQNAPPTRIRIVSEEGGLRTPFICAMDRKLDPATFKYNFIEDKSKEYPVKFFVKSEPYKILGFIPVSRRFVGVEGTHMFLFGTDRLGRDLFTRVLHGGRISLFIGFGGVFLSFILGCFFGGISGYFGGVADEIIQRVIELLMSIPHIPLWMALSAAVPRHWPVVKTYFAITIVLATVGWAGLARVVRGKLLSLREEEFALAAKAAGANEFRIITKHLLPAFVSYLIVNLTLSIPNMILGETALSFLGLGMQPPAVSWGVLLQDAQDIAAISGRPWQLIPVIFVVLTVLMFNFLGDGLRDAADPYSR